MMTATIKKSTAEKYQIQTGGKDAIGGEYATICLSSWGPAYRNSGSAYYGGEILINSSFGSFCHAWSACAEPFKKFLIGIGFDYFMTKCIGRNANVYDGQATFETAVKQVLTARRNGNLNKYDARQIYAALYDYKDDILESSNSFQRSLSHLPDEADNIELFVDAYEMIRYQPNPQAVGFWEQIWPAFQDQMKAETEPHKLMPAGPAV